MRAGGEAPRVPTGKAWDGRLRSSSRVGATLFFFGGPGGECREWSSQPARLTAMLSLTGGRRFLQLPGSLQRHCDCKRGRF